MHSSMKEFEGQAWCSGESCLTESLGHGFEAASPQILQRGGLPRFFTSLDPNHVGASSTRSAPFMKEFQTTRRNQEYRTAIKCSPLSLNMTGSHSGPPSWQIGQCQAPRSPKNLPDPHVCTIHLYFNTPPHVQAPLGFEHGNRSQLQLFLFNCSPRGFELNTSR